MNCFIPKTAKHTVRKFGWRVTKVYNFDKFTQRYPTGKSYELDKKDLVKASTPENVARRSIARVQLQHEVCFSFLLRNKLVLPFPLFTVPYRHLQDDDINWKVVLLVLFQQHIVCGYRNILHARFFSLNLTCIILN